MPYAPPFIGPAGLTIPSYADIFNLFVSNYQSIFGPGVYTGNDNPEIQQLSVVALAIADQSNATQLVYNNRSPATAVGGALDTDVEYNGLIRKAASYSSCPVILAGVAGTIINNGQVRDNVPGQGYLWNLPQTVTIGIGGTVTVTAICTVIGAVNALAGAFVTAGIATPTTGWTGLSNSSPAAVGQPVETDSQLRTRQAISTELPSITMLAGTIAGIAAVQGVTRQQTLENPTGAAITTWPLPPAGPSWYGASAHSITACVEGGADLDVATAIYNNRGIGPTTIGTTSISVTDPNSGGIFTVNFYRPTYKAIYVVVNAHGLTPGFGATVEAAIVTAIVNYLQGLALGGTVSWSAINAVAMAAAGNIENPIFDIVTLYIGTLAAPNTALAGVSVNTAGTGYTVGDMVGVTQGGASGGFCVVTSISGGGGTGPVTGIAAIPYSSGTGYAVATNLATTGGPGTGLHVNITSIGNVSDIVMPNPWTVAQGVGGNITVNSV